MIQPSPEEAATAPNFEKDAQEFFKYFDKTQDETDSDLFVKTVSMPCQALLIRSLRVQRLRGGLDGLLIYVSVLDDVGQFS
ncbi:hypothetical protein FRC00_004246, partial [Tulasnella sp. 408]